jgi:bacterioferritin-associated ferredoxin
MYVCICHGVTDRAIREAAAAGARELGDLAMMTGCGTGCGSCTDLAASLLVEARRERAFPLQVFAVPLAA